VLFNKNREIEDRENEIEEFRETEVRQNKEIEDLNLHTDFLN